MKASHKDTLSKPFSLLILKFQSLMINIYDSMANQIKFSKYLCMLFPCKEISRKRTKLEKERKDLSLFPSLKWRIDCHNSSVRRKALILTIENIRNSRTFLKYSNINEVAILSSKWDLKEKGVIICLTSVFSASNFLPTFSGANFFPLKQYLS